MAVSLCVAELPVQRSVHPIIHASASAASGVGLWLAYKESLTCFEWLSFRQKA